MVYYGMHRSAASSTLPVNRRPEQTTYSRSGSGFRVTWGFKGLGFKVFWGFKGLGFREQATRGLRGLGYGLCRWGLLESSEVAPGRVKSPSTVQ